MKDFVKYMFASMVGFLLAMFVSFFFLFIVIMGFAISFGGKKTTEVPANSVLEITLDEGVMERGSEDPFDLRFGTFAMRKPLGLDDILAALKTAAEDERITGVLLRLSDVNAGIGTLEEIRNGLLAFRASGKFVYAFSDAYTQPSYYLASVADKIYVHPQGMLIFHGLRAKMMFFKGTLEKLDIEPVVIRHGRYKSAVEPYMLDRMSPENREQVRSIVESIWAHFVDRVAESRKLDAALLDSVSDHLLVRTADDAVRYGLANETAYYDRVLDDVKKACGLKEKQKERLLPLRKYIRGGMKDISYSKNKIALVYAVGDINTGDGDDESIGSDRLAAAIRKARLDTAVKAIVLRVNSPGGSALASDVIWRETVLAKKEKPFVVSMGDVAASGGYYISCAADTIVAQPNTITGSIGVYGLLFNAQNMFSGKLGITFDTVKTGRYADIGDMTRPMTDDERAIIQHEVDRIYDRFAGVVSSGRGLTMDYVDSIGEGRVWSGAQAMQVGLVDVLGGIDTAVAIAARMAGLETYRIITLPGQKQFLERIMEDLTTESRTKAIRSELGDQYGVYSGIRSVVRSQGVQARLPYSLDIR